MNEGLRWIFDSGVIAILGGIYMVLLAYDKLPWARRSEVREYVERIGLFLKIGGPIVAIGGLIRLLAFLRA